MIPIFFLSVIVWYNLQLIDAFVIWDISLLVVHVIVVVTDGAGCLNLSHCYNLKAQCSPVSVNGSHEERYESKCYRNSSLTTTIVLLCIAVRTVATSC